jgi:hypothetical protein
MVARPRVPSPYVTERYWSGAVASSDTFALVSAQAHRSPLPKARMILAFGSSKSVGHLPR